MKSALIDPIINVFPLLMYLGTITAPFPISALHVIAGATLVVYTVGHSFRLAFIDQRKFSQVRLLGRMAFDACLSMLFLVASTSAFAFFHLLSPTTLISTFCLAVGGSLSIASVKQIRNEMKWPSNTSVGLRCLAGMCTSILLMLIGSSNRVGLQHSFRVLRGRYFRIRIFSRRWLPLFHNF